MELTHGHTQQTIVRTMLGVSENTNISTATRPRRDGGGTWAMRRRRGGAAARRHSVSHEAAGAPSAAHMSCDVTSVRIRTTSAAAAAAAAAAATTQAAPRALTLLKRAVCTLLIRFLLNCQHLHMIVHSSDVLKNDSLVADVLLGLCSRRRR
ncbi:uncharacterized protein LOC128201932 [Galleria mellonella]|uniref:Uncharacterized protein LOC128201932 n=1 Tax=Galleria mellonella TaxID=7137 RepID=A0ABM3MY95_GALME|nr:uncharacterized protein LOC128201932 [Galleria mellonella]